jgi:putative 4-mercaptohistidine N1-methyltranferase
LNWNFAMTNLYELDKQLAEYLLFHYGGAEEILPATRVWPGGMREALGFPVRTAGHFSRTEVARGLDLGCAVGRSTAEMARACNEVIGIDFSQAFITAAERLQGGEAVAYGRCEEAALMTPLAARWPRGIDPARVRFQRGDAMNLPADLGAFDRVHAANLLCRLAEPQRLLARLPELVVAGGELVLATPCTWLEEFTPPSNWPTAGTLEWLCEALSGHFDLQRQAEEPFLIRETARKFQWTTSLVTVWRRQP